MTTSMLPDTFDSCAPVFWQALEQDGSPPSHLDLLSVMQSAIEADGPEHAAVFEFKRSVRECVESMRGDKVDAAAFSINPEPDVFRASLDSICRMWSLAVADGSDVKHPIVPILKLWAERPILVGSEDGARRFPSRLAQVSENDSRAGRLFSLPAYVHTQQDGKNMTLPLADFAPRQHPHIPMEFLAIGENDGNKGGQAVSVAMRATLAGLALRPVGEQQQYHTTARNYLNHVFAGKSGIPKGTRSGWRTQLERASKLMDAAWIPYRNPDTGKTKDLRLATIGAMPRDIEDKVTINLTLPDNPDKGAPINPKLHTYAATERRSFYALLQLAFDWWQPGRTRVPIGKRGLNQWAQLTDSNKRFVRDRYSPYDRKGIVGLTAPLTQSRHERNAFRKGLDTLITLAGRGELQLISHGSGRGQTWLVLPPVPKDG